MNKIVQSLEWLKAICSKSRPVANRAVITTEPKTETTKEINVSDINASAPQPSVIASPLVEPVPVVAASGVANPAATEAVQTIAAAPAAIPVLAAPLSPLDAAKTEFEKFVAFVENGMAVFGADAEADLVALKDKYR